MSNGAGARGCLKGLQDCVAKRSASRRDGACRSVAPRPAKGPGCGRPTLQFE